MLAHSLLSRYIVSRDVLLQNISRFAMFLSKFLTPTSIRLLHWAQVEIAAANDTNKLSRNIYSECVAVTSTGIMSLLGKIMDPADKTAPLLQNVIWLQSEHLLPV